MSYSTKDTEAATDELRTLEMISEAIDQLSADARHCSTLAPHVKKALDIAWYYAEVVLRDLGKSSCGHTNEKRALKPCECCRHFAEVRRKAELLRGL